MERAKMKLEEIFKAIDNGDFDEDLEGTGRAMWKAIRQRIKARRAVTDAKSLLDIKIGDTVRFTRISPKYLTGMKAKVTGKANTRLIVTVEKSSFAGKYSGMSGVRVPISTVEKVA